ncbi:helix-turn-helix transcriptional regulator [Streptomyces actinomycinicus]|uniref:Helix-turn-helix transcriptional regulator n=1 Tax=Streptomyces actinomycinicus TaxID=1695166 RepID=A0A937JKE1_9ACTN|nr:helix-turn-helix transcriptional regulator [Streptomyces actinomycinicus]MBL1081235.1 helix-turn-helix transcriptional regulator [Streptomyces actinomycinicus]
MPRRQQPTARQERLGAELRKLREAAGLKGREAAALLGTDSAQMSQIEAGTAGVSEERVRRLAAQYSCTDDALVDALIAMATDRTRGWWEEYRGRLPTPFMDLPELEHHACYRWDVEFLHVPGLLQTAEYARSLFAYVNPEYPESDIERWVEHRIKRRVIIERAEPVPYQAVIHEAALRIRVGDRLAARAQLARILEVSEADHVTVRVVPFDLDEFGGAGAAMVYAGGPLPRLDTVVRDGPSGPVFIDAEAQLTRYRTLFRRVEAASLDPGRSRDLIHRLAKEL